MKLLIITSEKLNPENIISSTFELTQAKILSASFNVVILSVELEISLSSKIKSIIKKIFISSGTKTKDNNNSRYKIKQILKTVLFGKRIINKYIIYETRVIEGVGFYVRDPKNFLDSQRKWIKTGLNAFDKYCRENGFPDLIHAHGRFLNAGALAMAIKKKHGIKYVYTEHSTFFQRGLVPAKAIPICREVISEASVFTVVSSSLLNYIEKILHCSFPEVKIIPNALDKIFEEDLKTQPDKKRFVFTVVASIEHKKGIDVLVQAFGEVVKQREDIYLNICGDGPMKEDILEFVSKNDLSEKIKLLEKKTKQGILQLLDESHAFVLPSREETFGVVVIEALARGIPVIATRSGGPEFIITNDSGILVEPGNAEALEIALIKIAANYDSFDRQNIRQYALSKFGSSVFLQTMKKLYSEISDVSNR